jgi:hypothetical protein
MLAMAPPQSLFRGTPLTLLKSRRFVKQDWWPAPLPCWESYGGGLPFLSAFVLSELWMLVLSEREVQGLIEIPVNNRG